MLRRLHVDLICLMEVRKNIFSPRATAKISAKTTAEQVKERL